MANEKVIQTRLSLKIDTYANWTSLSEPGKGGNLVLNKGEVGFCEIPSGNTAATTAPTVLFKVGDGTHKFSELNWASALAADVYDWAKQNENDFVNTFLALKMTDGTTMQAKLDGVFATDAELSAAIAELRDEIPTQLGVMSIKVTDDDVVIGTPAAAASGDVTIDVKHAKKGPTGGATKGATEDVTVSGYGASGTIKVPKAVVDEYGHVTGLTEQTLSITMPGEQTIPTVNDGTLTLKASNGLTATQTTFSANDADSPTFEVKHGAKPTSGNIHATTSGSGRTYVTGISVDAYGHIAGVAVASETDQDLSNYKTKQTAVADQNLSGATVIKGVAQNENGEITISTRTLTAADLGLSKVMNFLGTTTTSITQGNTTAAVIIDGKSVTAAKGDVVLSGDKEFVWDGSKWQELGDQGSYALKTITITGDENNGLTGGGSLEDNRTIGIKDSGVTTAKIADLAVTSGKIDNGAVTQTKIANGAVTSIKLATDAVETEKIKNAAVTTAKIADKAVTADKLADGTITPGKLSETYLKADGSNAANSFELFTEHVLIGNTDTDSNDGGTPKTVRVNVPSFTYNDLEVATVNQIPNDPEDIGAKKVQAAVDNKIEKSTHVLSSLSQNTNGDISYEVKELTADTLGVNSSSYLAITMVSETAVVDYYDTGVDIKNGLYSDGKVVATLDDLPKTTDDLVGGSEIWIIDCGTSTTVI